MPYEKRKKATSGRAMGAGQGASVVIGDAVIEERGRRVPDRRIRDSATGQVVSGPGAQRVAGPSSPPSTTMVRIGDAYDVRPISQPDSLREAERRRYGKKHRTAYSR